MCYCGNNIELDSATTSDFKPCCGRIQGRRCLCVPYDDAVLITAQVSAIVAFGVSWIFWGSFLVSLVGLVLFQLPWCCRQNAAALWISVGTAAAASLSSAGAGVYALAFFPEVTHCDVFSFETSGIKYEFLADECREEVLAGIAFGCSFSWCVAAVLMARFVESGRHDVWERQYDALASNRDDSNHGKTATVDMLV